MKLPFLFDIHSHLNFRDFNEDREEVIKRTKEDSVWTVCVGADGKTSEECVRLAEKNENIFASVGLHPDDDEKFNIESYRKLAEHSKVVSIGECGIDLYRRGKNDFERQKDLFIKQIELSLELKKPLMIHCREAHNEVIKILQEHKSVYGNIHFFSGTWGQAQKYFDLGFTISFAGLITFSDQYDEIIEKAPLDKIMAETDAPFAAPVPYRGKRNEPIFVSEIIKKIADVRRKSFKEVAEITTQNALRFFDIR